MEGLSPYKVFQDLMKGWGGFTPTGERLIMSRLTREEPEVNESQELHKPIKDHVAQNLQHLLQLIMSGLHC